MLSKTFIIDKGNLDTDLQAHETTVDQSLSDFIWRKLTAQRVYVLSTLFLLLFLLILSSLSFCFFLSLTPVSSPFPYPYLWMDLCVLVRPLCLL